ncbi:MAG: hypothetical protein ACOCRK_06850 [bacterium]
MDIVSNFNPRNVKFGGAAVSGDYNKMNTEIAHDTAALFELLTNNDKKLEDIYTKLTIENEYLNQLKDSMDEILSRLEDKSGQIYVNFYQGDNIEYGNNLDGIEEIDNAIKATINNNYNVVTLPQVRIDNKTGSLDFEGNLFTPDTLETEIELYYNDDISNKININKKENTINNIYSQDLKEIYKLIVNKDELEYDNQTVINSITMIVTTKLPVSVNANKKANTILIDSFPGNSVEIRSVEYKSNYNGNWKKVDNFKTNTLSNSIYTLPNDTDVYEVRIKLKQSNVIDYHNNKSFVIGLKSLGIYNIDYNDKGSFFMKIKPKTKAERITKISPIINNVSEQELHKRTNLVKTQVYLKNTTTNTLDEYKIGSYILDNYDKDFYIKIDLKQILPISTPLLKGFTINYI